MTHFLSGFVQLREEIRNYVKLFSMSATAHASINRTEQELKQSALSLVGDKFFLGYVLGLYASVSVLYNKATLQACP